MIVLHGVLIHDGKSLTRLFSEKDGFETSFHLLKTNLAMTVKSRRSEKNRWWMLWQADVSGV
jgi:hypothetical protein